MKLKSSIKKLLIWENVPIRFKKLIYLAEAIIANLWFGFPAKRLKVVGVTGTDGKTTTCFYVYSILKAAGKKAALISTVGAKINDQEVDTGFHVTTPDAFALQKFVKRIADLGNEYLVLEVTSHGLDQCRVWGIPFEIGVLTNITHEHLDYHQTFENYLKAKAKLFQLAKTPILNRDDESFERLSRITERYFWYSGQNSDGLIDATTTVNLRGLRINLGGLEMAQLKEKGISIKLLGDYNWSNALAAATAVRSLNIDWEAIKTGIEAVTFIPGRMEEIKNNLGFRIFVDFAHTPNGLEKSLTTARQIAGQGKVIVVFGCAGLRDKGKRPLMGEIAGKLADVSILTAEDPRTEDVNQIIEEIIKGFLKTDAKEVCFDDLNHDSKTLGKFFVRVPDRQQAIRSTLGLTKANDLVIITGKGHEKSMCFGEKEYPWSDQEIVKGELKKYEK